MPLFTAKTILISNLPLFVLFWCLDMELPEFLDILFKNPNFRPVGEDLEKWSKLRKNFECIHLLLKNSIVGLSIKTAIGRKKMICTSNHEFIAKIIRLVGKNEIKPNKKQRNFTKKTFEPTDKKCVITWNLLTMDYAYLSTLDFDIYGFIVFSNKNSNLLTQLADKFLSKQVRNDQK